VKISTQNEEGNRPKGNQNQELPRDPEHHSEGSSTTQVLEMMRNLIVELQVFKEDTEKLKKAQEHQLEINEMLLHSIVTKKIPKYNEREEEVRKTSSKNSSHKTKKEENSSEDTHMIENKASTGRKRKQLDHLEGEFKKLKPSTFDGESKTGEEVEASY
jgi:hypothetical protein